MDTKVFPIDAVRRLKEVDSTLLAGGEASPYQAQITCFLAGRVDLARLSLSGEMQFDRYGLRTILDEALSRYHRGEIPLNWKDEWKVLEAEAVVKRMVLNVLL